MVASASRIVDGPRLTAWLCGVARDVHSGHHVSMKEMVWRNTPSGLNPWRLSTFSWTISADLVQRLARFHATIWIDANG
jgi:hypothetical protein